MSGSSTSRQYPCVSFRRSLLNLSPNRHLPAAQKQFVSPTACTASACVQDLGGVNLNPVRGGIPAAEVAASSRQGQQGFGMDLDEQLSTNELPDDEATPEPVAGGPAEGTYDWCVLLCMLCNWNAKTAGRASRTLSWIWTSSCPRLSCQMTKPRLSRSPGGLPRAPTTGACYLARCAAIGMQRQQAGPAGLQREPGRASVH